MRVAILTIGTRGDLELFLGLGQALASRGVEVVVGTSAFYADTVRAAGLDWCQVGVGEFEDLRRCLRGLADSVDLVARTKAYFQGWIKPELSGVEPRLQELVAGADLFISNLKLFLKRGANRLPSVFVDYDPPIDLAEFERLGIQSDAHRRTTLDLVAMDKRLIDPDDAWPAQYRFTGFWHGPDSLPGWAPGPELAEFMVASDDPPVAITLGSMATFDPHALRDVFGAGVRLAGRRAVLVRGWSDLPREADGNRDILVVDEAPYDWLFPRSACVVHHGGTGTVASVLRAGRVSVLVPQVACQAIYARLLTRQGLCAGSLGTEDLCPQALAHSIRLATEDRRLTEAARLWRQENRPDDGLACAADLIEQHAIAQQENR